MTTTEAPGRHGCPGWVKLLLIVSLAANLAIIGLVIGRSVQPHDEPDRGPDRVINWVIGMVPEERREMAIEHFAGAQEQIAAARADRGERVAEVVAAMGAEPFDPARLNAALDAMFDRRATGRTIVRERMISLLGQLTPGERQVFAQRFAERMTNGSDRRD